MPVAVTPMILRSGLFSLAGSFFGNDKKRIAPLTEQANRFWSLVDTARRSGNVRDWAKIYAQGRSHQLLQKTGGVGPFIYDPQSGQASRYRGLPSISTGFQQPRPGQWMPSMKAGDPFRFSAGSFDENQLGPFGIEAGKRRPFQIGDNPVGKPFNTLTTYNQATSDQISGMDDKTFTGSFSGLNQSMNSYLSQAYRMTTGTDLDTKDINAVYAALRDPKLQKNLEYVTTAPVVKAGGSYTVPTTVASPPTAASSPTAEETKLPQLGANQKMSKGRKAAILTSGSGVENKLGLITRPMARGATLLGG